MTSSVPQDAGEYYDDLLDILHRIPDDYGKYIDCGNGWYKLLAETNEKMKFIWPDYKIYQIKEKFGTLRFYWGIDHEDGKWQALDDATSQTMFDIMMDIEFNTESRSAYICEGCGAYGRTRNNNRWIKTYCSICALEHGYPLEDWEHRE